MNTFYTWFGGTGCCRILTVAGDKCFRKSGWCYGNLSPWPKATFIKAWIPQSGRGTRNAKKPLNRFQGCHENALNESFKMSPHLIGLGWHPRSLLWPASGSGLDMIWKLQCQLRHIKWGLILKLSLSPFLSHPWNPLRGFFAFRGPLPDCVYIQTLKRALGF